MKTLDHWTTYFNSIGLATSTLACNGNAVTIDNLLGAPVFRAVQNRAELDALHTKARGLSTEMKKVLILGLPFDNPASITHLGGDLPLPICRVYGGHTSASFNLHGHQIENDFSIGLKKEVTAIIERGAKVKTPLCDWLLLMASDSWPYGLPSSKEQLDSLLALVARNAERIGHVRSRQLSYGRGCADAVLLPFTSVQLPSHSLDFKINANDYRLISLEKEAKECTTARHRVYALHANKFLNVLAQVNPRFAQELGCGSTVGGSTLGTFKQQSVKQEELAFQKDSTTKQKKLIETPQKATND